METKEYFIDCDSRILGRLASHVAKLLLQGNSVTLVNAELTAISGHTSNIVASYKQKLEWQDKANPEHSPYWSRRPDMFVKRIVRGMLPYKKPRGQAAYKRLRVYIGVPSEVGKEKLEKNEIKHRLESYENAITIKELSERLGYRLS